MLTIQKELSQFQQNNVLNLISPSKRKNIIGTNVISQNQQGEAIRNKNKVVAQDYIQQESIKYKKKLPVI